MRILLYGLMALALSVSAALMSVHHSGADAHAAPAAPQAAVHHDAIPHDTTVHSDAMGAPDAHPPTPVEACLTCSDGGESLFLMACVLLAVLISVAALVHPAQSRLAARPEMAPASRPRPPDEPCAPREVNLHELCVSRR